MKKKLIIMMISLASMTSFAEDTRPKESEESLILQKLNSIESRLTQLEGQQTTVEKTSDQAADKPKIEENKSVENIDKDDLLSGMIIKLTSADSNNDNWMEEVLNKEYFKGFITKNAVITTDDITKESLGYKGPYSLTAEGFFNAKEKGIYNFGVLHAASKKAISSHSTNCKAQIKVNSTEIASFDQEIFDNKFKGEKTALLSGSATLSPGLYEYSVRSTCDDFRKFSSTFGITRSFFVKTPSDLSMRELTEKDIYHKK